MKLGKRKREIREYTIVNETQSFDQLFVIKYLFSYLAKAVVFFQTSLLNLLSFPSVHFFLKVTT